MNVVKIRMLVSMAGADENWQPGDEREVTQEVADAWKAAGLATIVGPVDPGDTSPRPSDKAPAKKGRR